MQRVTALTRQKRNPDRINVFLDETFAFGLAEIAAARLQIGQMLSPEEIAELKRQDSFEKAKQSAFKLISYRPRSVAEVARNLREKSYDEAVVSEVIARMQELQLLDDHAFALYWIEQRETFKPRSFMAILGFCVGEFALGLLLGLGFGNIDFDQRLIGHSSDFSTPKRFYFACFSIEPIECASGP